MGFALQPPVPSADAAAPLTQHDPARRNDRRAMAQIVFRVLILTTPLSWF